MHGGILLGDAVRGGVAMDALTVAEAILLLLPSALWSESGEAPPPPVPRLPPLAEWVVVVEVGVWGVLCASWMYATSCTQWRLVPFTRSASRSQSLLLTVRLCGESRPCDCDCDCDSECAEPLRRMPSSTGTRYGSVVE